MVDGVTTRLQKEVNQLQKDVATIESKLDSIQDKLQGEIQLGVEKGLFTIKQDLEKMILGLMSKVVPLGSATVGSGMTEAGSPVSKQVGAGGSTVDTSAAKNASLLNLEVSNLTGDSSRFNPRRSKLDCPKFDGYDFLGWRLKIEQYFDAVGIAEEDKVQTAMIHLDGKALQWHQRFMKSRGSLKEISWLVYMKEMRARFSDNE